MTEALLLQAHDLLLAHYDIDRWHWRDDTPAFDICLGAILVQHTAWTNVEHALDSLRAAGIHTSSRSAPWTTRPSRALDPALRHAHRQGEAPACLLRPRDKPWWLRGSLRSPLRSAPRPPAGDPRHRPRDSRRRSASTQREASRGRARCLHRATLPPPRHRPCRQQLRSLAHLAGCHPAANSRLPGPQPRRHRCPLQRDVPRQTDAATSARSLRFAGYYADSVVS